jgi:hypothetical protein
MSRDNEYAGIRANRAIDAIENVLTGNAKLCVMGCKSKVRATIGSQKYDAWKPTRAIEEREGPLDSLEVRSKPSKAEMKHIEAETVFS